MFGIGVNALSAVAQICAAFIALSMINHSSGYKKSWAFISAALILMIQRSIYPLYDGVFGNALIDEVSSVLGLVISMLMISGFWGLRTLFITLDRRQRLLARQSEEFERLAMIDSLTSIDNRRSFMMRAKGEASRCRRLGRSLSILTLDLDHFKNVNDHCGHAAGDAVLRDVAGAVKAALRASDVFGRIGGEEFAILLPEVRLEQALATAERVRDCVEAIDGGTPRVTVSVGVAEADFSLAATDAGMIEATLRRADQALYRAKAAGRNQVRSYGPTN